MNCFICKLWDELKKHRAKFTEGFRPPVVQTVAFENPTWRLRLPSIKCTTSGVVFPTPLGKNFLLLPCKYKSPLHLAHHTRCMIFSLFTLGAPHSSSPLYEPASHFFFKFLLTLAFHLLLPPLPSIPKALKPKPRQVKRVFSYLLEPSSVGKRPHL